MKERHAQGSDPGIRGNPGNPGNPGSGTRIFERRSLLLGLRQGPPRKSGKIRDIIPFLCDLP